MAVKPPNTQVQSNLNLANKRQGSGFVGFDRTAQQNAQQSQQLGQKIGSGVQQQVQGVQQAVQGTIQGQQNLQNTEQQRLGQADQVKQQIGTAPSDVNKSQYQDLTSGRIQAADVGAVQQFQGSLGQTAQQAQGLVRDPNARLSAIRQFANQPLATQQMSTAQRGLDATLLGRNVDLQGLAGQTARQSFGLDRQVGSAASQIGATNEQLRNQALEAQSGLRTARQGALTGEYSAAEEAARQYEATTGKFLKDLNYDNILAALGGQDGVINKDKFIVEGAPQVKVGNAFVDVDPVTQDFTVPDNFQDRLFRLLEDQGIDAKNLDITDIGLTGAINQIKSGISGREAITREEALTNEQRARLKALYGLEDEGSDRAYLEEQAQEFKPVADFGELKRAAEASRKATEAAKQRYDQSIALIAPKIEQRVRQELAGLTSQGNIGQTNIGSYIQRNAPELMPQVEAAARQLAQQEAKRVGLSPDVSPDTLMGRFMEQAAREVGKQNEQKIVDSVKKREFSMLESAARAGITDSEDVNAFGETYLRTPDLGTSSGWARAIGEVREAFAPYVARQVQTLAGGQKGPQLVGGQNVQVRGAPQPGRSQFETTVGDMLYAPGNVLNAVGQGVSQIPVVGRPVGQVISGVGQAVNLPVKAVAEVFCFLGSNIVNLFNRPSTFAEIQPGDIFASGEKVLAVITGVANDFYKYKDVIVTGSHAVLEEGQFIRVKDSKLAKKLDIGTNPVYSVITDKHTLTLGNTVFADFIETENVNLNNKDSLKDLTNNFNGVSSEFVL